MQRLEEHVLSIETGRDVVRDILGLISHPNRYSTRIATRNETNS
jgi:hypothetical protein